MKYFRYALFALLIALGAGYVYKSQQVQPHKPVVGVSGSSIDSWSVKPIMQQLKKAGALPVYLDHRQNRDPAQDILKLDGVVLAGNRGDINPKDYGVKDVHPETNIETNHKRRDYEYAITELALEQGVPFFGICGGMQRLNVSGDASQQGTLVQHIEGENQGTFNLSPQTPFQFVEVVEGSRLSTVAMAMDEPSLRWEENSYHHQGIGRLREGFVVSARTEKGVIEAMEPAPDGPYANQFVLGTQWHPEHVTSDFSKALWKDFVQQAKHFSTLKHR